MMSDNSFQCRVGTVVAVGTGFFDIQERWRTKGVFVFQIVCLAIAAVIAMQVVIVTFATPHLRNGDHMK